MASAVNWFGLGATSWARPAEVIAASRPSVLEIRFSPTIMGVSLSRVDPTRPESERRAGLVVRDGQWSIVTEYSVHTANDARTNT